MWVAVGVLVAVAVLVGGPGVTVAGLIGGVVGDQVEVGAGGSVEVGICVAVEVGLGVGVDVGV